MLKVSDKRAPIFPSQIPIDTGSKLNVLCTFNLRPVSMGPETTIAKKVF